ncbi:MAG TPA: hypothetical protein VF145_07715, partial [Chitinophagaceae bacterium]
TSVSESELQHLRQLVRAKSGLKCDNFNDMQLLQEKIRYAVNEYLSIQTLSRFFGLTKTEFNPASYTLLVLARYSGYHSFEELQQLSTNTDHNSSLPVIRLLTALFSESGECKTAEEKLVSITRNVHGLIEHDDQLAEEVYKYMSSVSFGREYFFEKLVHIDALDRSYGEALQYYLMHATTNEQRFFGCSLLCFRYMLTNDHRNFNHYYAAVQDFTPDEVSTFRPFVAGRYPALILYAQLVNRDPSILHRNIDTAIAMLKEPGTGFPYDIYYVSEALILLQEFEIAFRLLNRYRQVKTIPDADEGYIAQLELFRIFSGFFAGALHPSRQRAQISGLRSNAFNIFCTDYFSVFLYLLQIRYESNGGARVLHSRISHLVNKTGFIQLYTLVNSIEHVGVSAASAFINGN